VILTTQRRLFLYLLANKKQIGDNAVISVVDIIVVVDVAVVVNIARVITIVIVRRTQPPIAQKDTGHTTFTVTFTLYRHR